MVATCCLWKESCDVEAKIHIFIGAGVWGGPGSVGLQANASEVGEGSGGICEGEALT